VEPEKMLKFGYLLDPAMRVKRWPKKIVEKLFVLEYLQTKLEIERKYSEKEVNTILKEWHLFNDHALLRRELYDRYYVNRTTDGREYWID
jgi:hypothetical protein